MVSSYNLLYRTRTGNLCNFKTLKFSVNLEEDASKNRDILQSTVHMWLTIEATDQPHIDTQESRQTTFVE